MWKYLHKLEDKFKHLIPDWYWNAVLRFMCWREETFPWYYSWQLKQQHIRDMTKIFGFVPQEGDFVSCHGEAAQRIVMISRTDSDEVLLENGEVVSLLMCCGPVKNVVEFPS